MKKVICIYKKMESCDYGSIYYGFCSEDESSIIIYKDNDMKFALYIGVFDSSLFMSVEKFRENRLNKILQK